MPATAFLTRETLEAAFRELGLKARAADKIGITTAEQAIEIVSQYYPPSGIPPKTYFGIEEIFARLSGSDR